MSNIIRVRRVVGAAYARRYSDAITVELLESVEGEFDRWHAAARAEPGARARSGRNVFGLTIATLIFGAGVAFVLWWFTATGPGSCVLQTVGKRWSGHASSATMPACSRYPSTQPAPAARVP